MTPLCELARKYKTDKGGNHTLAGSICHNYTPVYYGVLGGFADQVESVLEIGVNTGNSLRMWREFFPNAEIYGLDIRRECLVNEARIHSLPADQSNSRSLHQAMATISVMQDRMYTPTFDLIIDDGSHVLEHQITSLQTLLPYLSDRGIYFVEDLTYDPDLLLAHVPDGFTARVVDCETAIGPQIYRPELVVITRA